VAVEHVLELLAVLVDLVEEEQAVMLQARRQKQQLAQ
tara:strand:- start:251 stop:361 length:111 start_codon:yes stop_codon:yes gene_type:complete